MAQIKNWTPAKMNQMLGDKEAFEKVYELYVRHMNKMITGKDGPIKKRLQKLHDDYYETQAKIK